MQYQLPSGKVVYMSVEQYLCLTDADIIDLIAINYGCFITSPMVGSAVNSKKKKDTNEDIEEEEDIDTSIDYEADSDTNTRKFNSLRIITIDELQDLDNFSIEDIDID